MKRKSRTRTRDIAGQAIKNIRLFLDDEITSNEFGRFNKRLIDSFKSQMSLDLGNSGLVKRFG